MLPKPYLISALIILFTTIFSFSQNDYFKYNHYCNEATDLIEIGELDAAYVQLVIAFSFVEKPYPIDCFNMAKCYSQMDEPDSTLKYINASLGINSRINLLIRTHYLWFEPILGKEIWKEVVASTHKVNTFETKKETDAFFALVDKYEDPHYNIHKTIRDSLYLFHKNDSLLIQSYLDSANNILVEGFRAIDQYLDDKGLPVLYEHSVAFTFISRYIPDWFFEKHDKLFLEEVQKGNLHPFDYAEIYMNYKKETQNEWSEGTFSTASINREEIAEEFGYPINSKTYILRHYYSWPYD